MRYEVHGFAGLGYPFTASGIFALERLIDDLPAEAGAETYPYWEADDIAEAIIFRAKKHNDKPTVILFGHSWGVKTALEAAERLRLAGIPIAYFAAIDATALPAKTPAMFYPSSVQKADEFWSGRGLFFNFPKIARWRDPKGSKGGMVTNPYHVPLTRFVIPAAHIATGSHPEVRKRIVSQVAAIIE